MDILLRRIKAKIPGVKVFAFADDVALVLEDVGRDLTALRSIFEDLEKVAGLALNKEKCVLIPLWPSEVHLVKAELVSAFPTWADMHVACSGVYLGVSIGPLGHEDFWSKAVQKFLRRAKDWGRVGLGLYWTSLAYSTYVLPVLSFLAQFRIPSAEVMSAEDTALRLLVPGPYAWCSKHDLFVLNKHYGQARNFPSLWHLGLSARSRMIRCENSARGGHQISQKCSWLTAAAASSTHTLIRQEVWGVWFRDGLLRQMRASETQLVEIGLSPSTLFKLAAGRSDDDEDSGTRNKRARKNYQKTIRKELLAKLRVDPVARMRFELERWNLTGFPGDTARRLLLSLVVVKAKLPPKVGAAVLRTAWNGWCTARRFQHLGKCLFGCGSFMQEDSI